jgi:flagellar hook-basal body complex protein FliE
MSISSVAMQAYTQQLQSGGTQEAGPGSKTSAQPEVTSFQDTIKSSLAKVNDLQTEKSAMIEDFASGKNQNVQEVMVALQKAGVAMKMTTAVRGKVMEAYKELMNMPL